MFPPELAPARARGLRASFERLGYTTAGVCERAACTTPYAFRTLRNGRTDGTSLEDGLDALIRLFMDGEPVERTALEALLPGTLIAELRDLELVRSVDDGASEHVAAAVLLYPTEGLYVMSDLELDPDHPEGRPDTVYPAIARSGEVYLSQLPRSPSGTFLEVCSGTGIAALLAARAGARAWAVDITRRSTEFARFNARLNGIDGLIALQGDLFEPVRGLRFDHIAAHPPYVPAIEQHQIYRDGGADGEQITRRLLATAGKHLEPGGHLYCTCVATDRRDAPLEQRVREMLGPGAAELDVVLLVTHAEDATEYLAKHLSRNILPAAEADQYRRVFQEAGVEQFVGATIVVVRHEHPGSPVTMRRQRAPDFAPVDVDSLLRWTAWPDDGEGLRRLLDVRPRLAPRTRMNTSHEARDGVWVPRNYRVTVDSPLPVAIDTSPQAATFLARCDGSQTVREHCERLEQEGSVEAGAPMEAFAEMVRKLLVAGLLQAELPPSGSTNSVPPSVEAVSGTPSE